MDDSARPDRQLMKDPRGRAVDRFAAVWRELADSPLARVPSNGSDRLLTTLGGVLEAFTHDEVETLTGQLEQLADALEQWVHGGAVPVLPSSAGSVLEHAGRSSDVARRR
jgi:hypothetical protein